MEGFETKKALLQRLGKNENDRKLVDRMLLRGEVVMEDGMYYLVDKEERIRELEFLVEKLRGELTTIKESDGDLEEAKVQWEYWEKECRRYGKLINMVIGVCYKKLKMLLGGRFTMAEDEFKEAIIEEVKNIEENIN